MSLRTGLVVVALAGLGRAQEAEETQAPQRGWRHLVGQPALGFSAKDWLNTDGATPAPEELQGKVWLLDFFATWCGPCMEKVEKLSELHRKYADVGFRVVAFSSEPVETLQRKMVEGRGVKFWLASDPDRKTIERYCPDGAATIPRFYLVGPDGKVVHEGMPSEATLRELLEQPLRLEKTLHDKLARARTAFDAGCFGAAHKIASALCKDGDSAVASDAQLLCEKIAAQADYKRKLLSPAHVEDPNERYGELLRYSFWYGGLEAAKWAKGELAELAKHDRVKSFKTEWSKLENALRSEMLAEGKPEKLRLTRKLYEDVAQKYARSHVGKLAAADVERLGAAK